MSAYPTTITNPDVLRHALPDLTAGIPKHLWEGADGQMRQLLASEYRRQVARRRDDDQAAQALEVQRIVARPAARPTPLLIEVAAIAGTLVKALANETPGDAIAPPSPETQS